MIFGDGKVLLYNKNGSDFDSARMEYVDYGVSVLTREVIVNMIAAGENTDLAPVFSKLSAEGALRGYEVYERFYEVGSPQGLDDFTAYISNLRVE